MLNHTAESPVLPRGVLSPDPLGAGGGSNPPAIPPSNPAPGPSPHTPEERKTGPGPSLGPQPPHSGPGPTGAPPIGLTPPAPAPAPARQQRALGERHCVGPGEGGEARPGRPRPIPGGCGGR